MGLVFLRASVQYYLECVSGDAPFMMRLGNAGVMKVGVRWVGETLAIA